jgi:hypothetical protein
MRTRGLLACSIISQPIMILLVCPENAYAVTKYINPYFIYEFLQRVYNLICLLSWRQTTNKWNTLRSFIYGDHLTLSSNFNQSINLLYIAPCIGAKATMMFLLTSSRCQILFGYLVRFWGQQRASVQFSLCVLFITTKSKKCELLAHSFRVLVEQSPTAWGLASVSICLAPNLRLVWLGRSCQ